MDKNQSLKYYFMVGHPGEDMKTINELKRELTRLKNVEQFQMFTPTPMTLSSCMYWTDMNPFTLQHLGIVYDYHTKKRLKRIILDTLAYQQGYKIKSDKSRPSYHQIPSNRRPKRY